MHDVGIEIERKFLVHGDGWRQRACSGVLIRQGYLAADSRCSVRVRLADGADPGMAAGRAWLTVKGPTR